MTPVTPGMPLRPLFTLHDGLELVLASASPRRRQFMAEWGLPFQTLCADAPEPRPEPGEMPDAYTRRAAVAKARAVAHCLAAAPRFAAAQHCLVLAADTVVAVDGDILGKPENPGHALRMLERLNGRGHEVISAVCLLAPDAAESGATPLAEGASAAPEVQECSFGLWRQLVFSDMSRVFFCRWPCSVLRAYVRTGEPADKAGAYAVQGQGAALVERVEGSWSTVVGLPVTMLAGLLLRRGLMSPAAAR